MKAKPLETRAPKTQMGKPEWWHNHGHKMHVKELDLTARRLVIEGGADVTIAHNAERKDEIEWLLDWEVSQGGDELVRGRRTFTSAQLAAAFGVNDTASGEYGEWLLDRYGGESAEQMLYIRWKDFLNIPCPGTGHDGDPNVSIFLWPETVEAVRQLLAGQ